MAILKNPKQSSKVVAAILSLAMLCLPVNTLASQTNSQLATATLSSPQTQAAERADGITQDTQSSTPANQLILDTPVIDEVGLLNTQQNQALSERLRQIHQQGKAQIAIVIVPSTDGEPIFDYAMQVADRWGLGNKDTDNGLLIVVAANDRKMQILTGYGLEGIIPDAIAKRIIREQMTPAFKDGRYADGLMQAVDAIDSRLQADPETLARMNAVGADASEDVAFDLITLFIIALIIGKIVTGILRLQADPETLARMNAVGADASEDVAFDLITLFIIALIIGKIVTGILGRVLGASLVAIGFVIVGMFAGLNVLLAILAASVLFLLLLVSGLSAANSLGTGGQYRGGGRSGRSSGGFGGSSGGFDGGGYRGGGGSFGGGGAGGSW